MSLSIKYIALFFIATTLVGCGGGSDESAPPPPVQVKADFDNDGIPDETDPDDDNDGVADAEDAFPLDPTESLDTDSDGIGNNADPDDDNDGVTDAEDAFPLDPAESLDTDSDGIGNNADPDDDNDGVADADDTFPLDASEWQDSDGDGVGDNADILPQNPLCNLASDATGGRCYVEVIGEMTEVSLMEGQDSTLYFFLKTSKQLLPYDVQSKHFGSPINIGQADSSPSQVIFHQGHDRFYLAYDNGLVTSLANEAGATETIFANLDFGTILLAVFDKFVVVNSSHDSRIYRENGEYSEGSNYFRDSKELAWNATNNRLYFLTTHYSPRDIYYTEINKDTGELISTVDSPYHGDYQIEPPITISPNGQHVLLGSGDVYQASDLTLEKSIGFSAPYFHWLSDTEIVALKAQDGQILVRRLAVASSQVLEQFLLEGELLALTTVDGQQFITYRHEGVVHVHHYAPSDDTDGDGVVNTQDAFPSDAAASLDSDFDGYPDTWNEGKTQTDSSTGLSLDAYPLDSACYLAAHGNGGQCDFGSTVPNFTPDSTLYDDTGIVYLLDSLNGRVYRWSSETQSYLNPFVVGMDDGFSSVAPTIMAVSNTHERLYLGYASGAVTKIDLKTPFKESWFTHVATNVGGLAGAGDYLLVEDASGAWNTHYTFDIDGKRLDAKDWNYHSTQYAWNAANQRLFFYRDDTSPNDLHFEEIAQQTGLIGSQGETPYHGDYNYYGPIKLSPTGNRVLIGSGELFDTDTMEHVGSLSHDYTDAVWGDNAIVSVASVSGQYNLAIHNKENYQLEGTLAFEGTALAIMPKGQDVLVVQKKTNGLSFATHIIADHDGDGLPGWWESLYGLDDRDAGDAAQDPDQDKLTNLQEFAARTQPNNADSDLDGLTDGEEVTVFNTNPLEGDSDQDGLNDGTEINTYGTNPLSNDSDADGITDYDELTLYATNPLANDSDNDGLADLWEVTNATDPNANDSQLDPDSDGLVNIDEFTYTSNPQIADTDNDGLSDGDEVHTHLTNPVVRDTDNDFMDDGWEITFTLDPLSNADAGDDLDGDTYTNLEEYFLGSLPDDAASMPQALAWSTYQGNASHNGFVAQRIDPGNLTERWTLTGTQFVDSVAIADGRLFGATYSKGLTALDMNDGHIVWQKQYSTADFMNSPAYYDGKLYFQTGGHSNSFLRAVDATNGDLLFKSSYKNQWARYQAPTVTQDGVYIAGGYYGGAYRFNKDTGLEEWFRDLEQVDRWTSAVRGEQVYFFKQNGLIKANKATGETIAEITTTYNDYNAYTPVLGFVDDAYAIRGNTLIAFDTLTNEVKWALEGGNYQQPVVGMAIVLVVNNGALNVLNSRTGELLWAWEPGSGQYIQSNIVVTPNLVFVGDNTNTYAIDLNTHQVVWSHEATGSLSLSNEGALVIHNNNGEISVINTSGDTDADGMPDWWEQRFGLDLDDPSDAALDTDVDGLSNLEEFDAGSQPTNQDSDGDGLNDGPELNTYGTNPTKTDTDGDQLSDYDEVITYATDPLLADTDSDGFSDGQEVLLYLTDPNDINSVPTAINSYQESFEAALLPASWSNDAANAADWFLDSSISSDGSQSIRAGDIGDNQSSSISFQGLFADGMLSFDAKVSAESCCDYLFVFVDGQQVERIANGDWLNVQINITNGEHTIEWRYSKDGSVSTGDDTAWIDKVHFVH